MDSIGLDIRNWIKRTKPRSLASHPHRSTSSSSWDWSLPFVHSLRSHTIRLGGCPGGWLFYDLIIKLVADDLASIAKTVVETIRPVQGVLNTKTLAGADI